MEIIYLQKTFKFLVSICIKENYRKSIMKGYTSLGSSPNTNYIRFNDNGGSGSGSGSGGRSIVGSPGSLGGLGDNLAFKRFETYMSSETLQKREINRNSDSVIVNQNLYTTENIIQNVEPKSEQFVPGEIVYKTIVIPFYVCLMDIIIFNDLFIEVVDNGSIETKNKVLISGKIRKYRLNGVIKNYDIFIEMENEDVFHVKKRGIMMRVRVPEELRQLILNTMVNYVADGGDLVKNSDQNLNGEIINAGVKKNKRGCFSCFGC
jgi:translation initiation factor 2 beta subunit (eIF-2beta)/eIF-5